MARYEELCNKLGIKDYYICNADNNSCLLSKGFEVGDETQYCPVGLIMKNCELRSEKKVFSEFTPSKQVELLKFLWRQGNLNLQYFYLNNKYGFVFCGLDIDEVYVENEDFIEGLLEFVLKLLENNYIKNEDELKNILERGL